MFILDYYETAMDWGMLVSLEILSSSEDHIAHRWNKNGRCPFFLVRSTTIESILSDSIQLSVSSFSVQNALSFSGTTLLADRMFDPIVMGGICLLYQTRNTVAKEAAAMATTATRRPAAEDPYPTPASGSQ
jgi:hypothetical protein